jgi:tetratricopeptide (TPR) repeat protein
MVKANHLEQLDDPATQQTERGSSDSQQTNGGKQTNSPPATLTPSVPASSNLKGAKFKSPHFSFTLQFRRTFRPSNSTRYQSYFASLLGEIWLSTEAKYYSHSMACFFELSMLYESTTKHSDDLTSPLGKARTLPHDPSIDFVATVREWSKDSNVHVRYDGSLGGGHCANVNIAHAYKWYYGSKEPGNPRDIRLAIKHYNSALQESRIHFTGDILQSLSRACTQLFYSTIRETDLLDAIKFAEQAVENTPPEDELRGRYTSELCELLGLKAKWTGAVENADLAVKLARTALLAGQVPGIRGTLIRALITSLATAYEMTGKEENVNDAVREFGRALQLLDSASARRQFGALKTAYQLAGETGILLPPPPTMTDTDTAASDPFQPFFDCLDSLKEEYLTDFQKFRELFFDPDLMEVEASLDLILSCIVVYYQHTGRRLDLALKHGLELLKFANSILEWFKKIIPSTEDIEQWTSYLEYMADRAELYVTLGDILVALGREDEARDKYELAVKDLKVGKENIFRTLTVRSLRHGLWTYQGSRFVDEYLEKALKEETSQKHP